MILLYQVFTTFLSITKSLDRLQQVLVLGESGERSLTVCSPLPSKTPFRMIPFSAGSAGISVIAGFYVTRSGKYRGIVRSSWAVMVLGWGLMTTLDDHSKT